VNKPVIDKLKRSVITIATGKQLYVDMAVNLARSFFLWHKDGGIGFQLVTDLPDLIPADIRPRVELISVGKGEIGEGFSTKLQLDKLVSKGQTLFIDADCLVYRDLNFVFDLFGGHAVSVVGGYMANGEWFGDVKQVCRHFGIKHMPKFNGGVYYLEKGKKATEIFDTARQIEKEYDEVGFVRLRNRPNDEVMLSVAMEIHGESPIPDDGSIMAEFVNFKSGVKSDLLNGLAVLYNDPKHKEYQPNWPLTVARPAIVHFLGHHTQVLPYLKEAQLLEYISQEGKAAGPARMLTFLKVTAPRKLATGAKNVLRPLYHKLFGARAVQKSERIIE
jgi:hypothetical protein